MINDKLPISKITLFIIALLVLGAMVYSVALKKSPPITVQPTPSSTVMPTPIPTPTLSPTPTPSAKNPGWLIYRNEKYGFELEYPKNFLEQTTTIDSGKNVLSLSSDLATFEIVGLMVSDNKNYDFSSINSFKEWHSKSEYMVSSDLQDVEKITIGQLTGLKTHELDGINSVGDYVYFKKGELIVYFVNDYNDHNKYKNSILATKIFNQIISTFKFI